MTILDDPLYQPPTWHTVPPWCANEKWQVFQREDGQVWAQVTGRELAPRSLKLNPIWWSKNSFEEQVADWYQPDWPAWRRTFYWNYLRNPMQNFRCFVAGVCDRNYWVEVLEGHPSPFVIQRNDIGESGVQRTRIHLEDGGTRDFVSWSDADHAWYYGTQASGIWGSKYNT